jgi:Flp pilus assembly protein TadB
MTEYRAIMAGLGLLVALAPLTAVWPVLDTVLVVLLLVAAGSAVAGYWLREAARELRFQRDMGALDARDAARADRTEVPV